MHATICYGQHLYPCPFKLKGSNMPLPSDEKLIQLGNELLEIFETMFGPHPGFRPAHAKGVLVTGTFTPSREAKSLTRAPHITRESTPVTARFSDGTGVPFIPDNDPNASPHGFAIRFQLAEHVHTDIISHSTDGFPARTGQDFIEFLRAAVASGSAKSSPTPIEVFLSSHPATLAFIQAPKPSPSSFGTEAYFGITAFRFINQEGVERYGRYRISPQAGVEHLDEAVAKAKDANYLFEELKERLAAGPIRFDIDVQVAGKNDVVDDATIHWPADRQVIRFGTVVLAAEADDQATEQKRIIFDPIPRVDGIEPSGDPLLELRAAIYLLSGRKRRQAPETQVHSSAV
jgi:catalase